MDRLADRRGVDRHVYEPAEDSYLLLSVAREAVRSTDRVLDVGTGSGFLASRLRANRGVPAVGVDINPHACRRAVAAGVPTARGHLTTPFRANAFDVVLCNPPYLPTAEATTGDRWFDRALDGGPTGRDVLTALLADLPRVLEPGGRAFLLSSSKTGIEAVIDDAEARGFRGSIEREATYPDEMLAVIGLTVARD